MKTRGPVNARIAWAMPSRWTFRIKPIAEFVAKWTEGADVIVDPFCGTSKIGTHRNDLGQGGMDAAEFCIKLASEGVRADVVLFDPPYSPRQISECYKSIGRTPTTADTQNAALYARVRKPLATLLNPGGIALTFGWSTGGFGWPIEEVLIVQHGGAHNDTLCTAQRKPVPRSGLFDSSPA